MRHSKIIKQAIKAELEFINSISKVKGFVNKEKSIKDAKKSIKFNTELLKKLG